MKLTIKSKKLKELSKENAQQVGGATLKGGEPQQAAGAHWPTLYSCVC